MLRFGTISDIDAEKGLAKVQFDEDGIVTKWIPIAVAKSKEDSFSFMFDTGEHVACLMDEHCENGLVLSAIYSKNTRPDGGNKDKIRVKFKDGASIEYDRSSHTLTIDGIDKAVVNTKEATITADTKVKIDCSDNEITGNLKVGGNVEVTGNVEADGDVKAAASSVAISLLTHKHSGVMPGPGITGTPVP